MCGQVQGTMVAESEQAATSSGKEAGEGSAGKYALEGGLEGRVECGGHGEDTRGRGNEISKPQTFPTAWGQLRGPNPLVLKWLEYIQGVKVGRGKAKE